VKIGKHCLGQDSALGGEDRQALSCRPDGFVVNGKESYILFKDTQWTVDQVSFVEGHKSVSVSVCHDLLLKFSIRKEDRVKVIKNLGRTLLDELENLFRSYWGHRLGVSNGLLQVLGHSVRVKTQEVQGYQLQVPENHVGAPVY
jgi:hypothetical protein